jgi:ATP-binding cassette subfamily B protein
VIDKGFAKGSGDAINSAFLGLGAVALVLAVATALRFFFVTRLGERVVADLRRALYGHTLTLDPAFFLKTRTGEVLSRMTTDITIVEQLVGASVSIALRNTLSLIGGLGYMAVVSPKLAGFIVLMVPVILAPIFLMGRNVRKLSVTAQDKFADAVGYAGESLDALDTVQAFGRERRGRHPVRRRGRGGLQGLGQADQRPGQHDGRGHGPGVRRHHPAAVGRRAPGAVGRDDARHPGPVRHAGHHGRRLGRGPGRGLGRRPEGGGAMERISELLNSEPGIAAPEKPQTLPVPARGGIAFEGVTFAYPGRPDLPALKGFDLVVRPGETVALVGPSGLSSRKARSACPGPR